jgi:hypothetical protein
MIDANGKKLQDTLMKYIPFEQKSAPTTLCANEFLPGKE